MNILDLSYGEPIPIPPEDRRQIEQMLVMVKLADLDAFVSVCWLPYVFRGAGGSQFRHGRAPEPDEHEPIFERSKKPWGLHFNNQWGESMPPRHFQTADALCRTLQEFVEEPERFTTPRLKDITC